MFELKFYPENKGSESTGDGGAARGREGAYPLTPQPHAAVRLYREAPPNPLQKNKRLAVKNQSAPPPGE